MRLYYTWNDSRLDSSLSLSSNELGVSVAPLDGPASEYELKLDDCEIARSAVASATYNNNNKTIPSI